MKMTDTFHIVGTLCSEDEDYYICIGDDGQKWLKDKKSHFMVLYDDFFKVEKWYHRLFWYITRKIKGKPIKRVWKTDLGSYNVLHNPEWYQQYLDRRDQ